MGNKNQDSDNENGYENGKGGDDEVRILLNYLFDVGDCVFRTGIDKLMRAGQFGP